MKKGLSLAVVLPLVLLASGGDAPPTGAAAAPGVGTVADTCEQETAGNDGATDGEAGAGASKAGEAPAAGAAPVPADTPDGEALMRRAAAVYDTLRTLRARFHQTVEMTVFEPPRRREGTGTWYQRKPSRFRMDFADPEGDLIVADGRHLWLYYPSTHPGQVIRTQLDGRGRGAAMVDLQGRIFELARTRYDVRYTGRDTLSGAAVHRVELSPTTEQADYRRVGVWLDAGNLLVRRLVFEDRGQTVRTVTLDDIRTGVSLADSLFHFRIPDAAEVFDG